ncbi:MAG: PAS domain S-box protein [Nitrospirae bacterium]|nr:PAS domain S-box protein [Nitrospirota bacterium]
MEREKADGNSMFKGKDLFYALIQNSSDIITVLETDGTVRYESPSIERVLGYAPDELTGRNAFETIHPDDLDCAREAFDRIIRDPAVSLSAEFRVRHKDGSWRLVEATGSNQIHNPLITGIVVNSRDVTDRGKAEELLKEATMQTQAERAKSEAIITAIGDGISVQDTDYTILYQNEVHKRMVGHHIGEKCYKAYQRRDRLCDQCHLAMSFRDGKIHKEEQSRVTDKGVRYYEISASPLRDSTGEIIAGIEAVRDITERKQMEERLRESEERFRRIFEDGPLGMIIADPGCKVLRVNKALCEMLDYTEQELVGKDIEEWTHPEDIEAGTKLTGLLFQEEGPLFHLEKRCVRKDGKTLWTNFTAAAIRDREGTALSAIAMIEDISERKWAEREREKLICELQAALANIKTLKGLIPMCAWCKKIREDSGYWKKVETYIQEHSDASFTHGICPDCLRKHDPPTYEKLFGNDEEWEDLRRERQSSTGERSSRPLTCVLSVTGGGSKNMLLTAEIEDISDAGMCVLTDRPLAQGSTVTFSDGRKHRKGIVGWQQKDDRDGGTYRVVIRFAHKNH